MTLPSESVDSIIIYADGACFGNPGPGGWGVRIEYPAPSNAVIEYGGYASRTTNNRMELLAAAQGLLATLDETNPIVIVTDSQYVKNGIESWIAGWKKKGWIKKDKEPVLNIDLWKVLDELNRETVRWVWVRGHSTTIGNNRVDEIATSFSKGKPVAFETRLPLSGKKLPSEPAETADALDNDADEPLDDDGDSVSDEPSFDSAPAQPPSLPCYVSWLPNAGLMFHTVWADCDLRVRGVSNAKFKKCKTQADYESAMTKWRL